MPLTSAVLTNQYTIICSHGLQTPVPSNLQCLPHYEDSINVNIYSITNAQVNLIGFESALKNYKHRYHATYNGSHITVKKAYLSTCIQ